MGGQVHSQERDITPGTSVCQISHWLNSFLAPKAECSQLFSGGAHSHVNEQLLQIRAFSVSGLAISFQVRTARGGCAEPGYVG